MLSPADAKRLRADAAAAVAPQLGLALEGAGARAVNGKLVVASVSGGKDSGAMSLWLKEREIEHVRIFADTGWEHPLTYEYLRGPLTDALGPIRELQAEVPAEVQGIANGRVRVTQHDPDLGPTIDMVEERPGNFVPLDFLTLVDRKAMFPSRVMRFCTEELKVKPIQRFLATLMDTMAAEVVNAVGIRRAESQARSKMGEWEWSNTMDCWVWRPLATWTHDDVVAIHKRHGLPMNPLYAMGATRVGCWPCIHARKSELALIARVDPGRIDLIRSKEHALNVRGHQRDRELGREELLRSMFWWKQPARLSPTGKERSLPIPIDDAVAWANSARGEWQPPGSGDGCARFGLCEVEAPDEPSSDPEPATAAG